MAPPDPSPSSSPPAPAAQTPESTPSPPQYYGTPTIQHNIALVAAIIGPIGLALPGGRGRKTFFSMQNMVLFVGSFLGINQLAHDYTGKSVLRRSNERWASVLQPFDTLPEKAKASKLLMEAERARRAAALPDGEREAREAEMRRRGEAHEAAQRGVLERVWMGNEKSGWQDRRREEDQKAIDSGKGIADIIMDQISEVWNWGKGKTADEGAGSGEADKQAKGTAESGKKP